LSVGIELVRDDYDDENQEYKLMSKLATEPGVEIIED
jgi:hypothetical protein